jgi:hypothetical protein
MTERRPLTDGIHPTRHPTPSADSQREREFVRGVKAGATTTSANAETVRRVPISTRIRSEFAVALKRASLERQLKGVEPNTLQDILEQAIEPWLKDNGYIA